MARRVIATADVNVRAEVEQANRRLESIESTLLDLGLEAQFAAQRMQDALEEAALQAKLAFERLDDGDPFQGLENDANRAGEAITGHFREAARQSSDAMRGFGSSILGMRGLMVGGAAAVGLMTAEVLRFGLGTVSTLEQAEARFLGLTGSEEGAAEMLRRLTEYAINTPFELPALADMASRLIAVGQNFGVTTDNVTDFIDILGNAASALGVGESEMNRVIKALGQMSGSGRVLSQDMNQLNQAFPGVNTWQILAEGLGTTERALRDAAAAGKLDELVSGDEAIAIILEGFKEIPGAAGLAEEQLVLLEDAFTRMSSAGRITAADLDAINESIPGADAWTILADGLGLTVGEIEGMAQQGLLGAEAIDALRTGMDEFAASTGAMDRQMGTLNGVMSKFKETASLALAEGLGPFVTELKGLITDEGNLGALSTAMSAFGDALSQMLDAVGPAIGPVLRTLADVLGMVGDSFQFLKPLIGPVVQLLGVLVNAGFRVLRDVLEALSPVFAVVGDFLDVFAEQLAFLFDDVMEAAVPLLLVFGKLFASIATQILPPLLDVLGQVLPMFSELFDEVLGPAITRTVGPIIDAFISIASTLADALMPVLPQVIDAFIGIVEAVAPFLPMLGELVAQLLTSLLPVLPPIVELLALVAQTVATALTDALLAVMPSIVQLATTLVDALAPVLPELVLALLALVEAFLPLVPLLAEIVATLLPPLIELIGFLAEKILLLLDPLVVVIEAVAAFVEDVIGFFAELFDVLVGHSIIPDLVNAIIHWFTLLWNVVETIVNTIKTIVIAVWNAIRTTVTTIVNGIKTTIEVVWNGIRSAVEAIVNGVKTTVSNVWNAIKSTTEKVWNAIKSFVETPVNAIKALIDNVIVPIKDTVLDVFRGIRDAIGGIWDSIKTTVGNAVQWVKDKIDSLLGPIDDILGKIGSIGGAIGGAIGGVFGGREQWWKPAEGFSNGGFGDFGAGTPAVLHGRETIIPLSNPGRALELMQQTGLDRLAAAGGRGGGGPLVEMNGVTIQDATDADLVAQRTLVALTAAMLPAA